MEIYNSSDQRLLEKIRKLPAEKINQVPFPFTDRTASKKRPAVVVSSDAYNRERLDLILIAVTTQTNPASAFGEMTIIDWQAAGLFRP